MSSNNKLILHGMYGSTCTQRVLMTLIENGAEYDFNLVDLRKGDHKKPEFVAHQPFGQIPVLQDGDYYLYESRAIGRYVNDTRGNKLVPSDPKAKGLMEQWLSTEEGVITPEVSGIVAQRIFAPMFGGQTDEAKAKEHYEKAKKGMEVMEQHLSKNEYLAGSQFTLADIYFLPYFNLALLTPEKDLLESRPNVMAWFKRCTDRPSWKEIQPKNEFAQK